MQLIERFGPFIILPLLFVVIGSGILVSILFGLLTGGPRALREPGAPYIYDRIYYTLYLYAIVGWFFAILAYPAFVAPGDDGSGFMFGWGICAIGMGSLLLLRGDMMLKGAQYQAKYGFWMWRFYNHMLAAQLDRQSPMRRKLIAALFLIAGVIVLVISLAHLHSVLMQIEVGTRALVHVGTSLLHIDAGFRSYVIEINGAITS